MQLGAIHDPKSSHIACHERALLLLEVSYCVGSGYVRVRGKSSIVEHCQYTNGQFYHVYWRNYTHTHTPYPVILKLLLSTNDRIRKMIMYVCMYVLCTYVYTLLL